VWGLWKEGWALTEKKDEVTKGMVLPDRMTILTLQLLPWCTVRTFTSSHTASRFTTMNTLTGSTNLELSRTGRSSLENSVDIVTRLWAGLSGFNPERLRIFLPSAKHLLTLWVPPTFLLNCSEGFFLGVKRPGREVDHSHPSIAKVKNKWSYTSITEQIP